MNRVGLFGGTFDPVHLGHLITAQFLCEVRKLDKIIFIPCFISPHKTDKKHSSSLHRLNMVRLAVNGINNFSFTDIEILKEEISFTIDTLRILKDEFSELELIIGYDNILTFDTWKKPDDIFNYAKVVVMKRLVDKKPKKFNEYYDRALFVDTPLIQISSTEIRKRVKEKKSIDFLVTEKVKHYIYEHNLYLEEF